MTRQQHDASNSNNFTEITLKVGNNPGEPSGAAVATIHTHLAEGHISTPSRADTTETQVRPHDLSICVESKDDLYPTGLDWKQITLLGEPGRGPFTPRDRD